MFNRSVFGFLGLVCTALTSLCIYGFAVMDGKLEYQGGAIGFAGVSFFAALVATCFAVGFFQVAFGRRGN